MKARMGLHRRLRSGEFWVSGGLLCVPGKQNGLDDEQDAKFRRGRRGCHGAGVACCSIAGRSTLVRSTTCRGRNPSRARDWDRTDRLGNILLAGQTTHWDVRLYLSRNIVPCLYRRRRRVFGSASVACGRGPRPPVNPSRSRLAGCPCEQQVASDSSAVSSLTQRELSHEMQQGVVCSRVCILRSVSVVDDRDTQCA